MRVPLSWLRDFVTIAEPPEAIASRLTFAGLEVEQIHYIGSAPSGDASTRGSGFAWSDAIVIAEVRSAAPHPNSDHLTVLRLDDGSGAEQEVVTGAPNARSLEAFDSAGSRKVVYARAGAVLNDAHKGHGEIITVRRAVLRGVESRGVVCSERELGISDDHEGILLVEPDATVGMSAAAHLGDAILEVKINPNMARNASILGIARELAALTGAALTRPDYRVDATGPPVDSRFAIRIETPTLNPRFVGGLVEGVTIGPSPLRVQRRLRAVDVRPISNVVDATNYAMFEIGQPLHAFDLDVLVRRAGGRPPTLITRLAHAGETLRTLDGVERRLDEHTILVCDTAGPLSIAGLMGGAEAEVTASTRNVLLEAASWDMVSIRRAARAQNLASEAAYRFSRGVHPEMAPRGLTRGLAAIQAWSGGAIARGVIDEYPRRADIVTVDLPLSRVTRLLGVEIPPGTIVTILRSLEFGCEVVGGEQAGGEDTTFRVTAPDHRLDIGLGVIGQADLIEEIGRVYGYDRVPAAPLAGPVGAALQRTDIENEEHVRDLLVDLNLREAVTYSLTSVEREARLQASTDGDIPPPEYVKLLNPIAVDRSVMRRTLLPGLLDAVALNMRHADRIAMFEIGPVYIPRPDEELPAEPAMLALALAGPRDVSAWQNANSQSTDFFDLKGIVEELLAAIRVEGVAYRDDRHAPFLQGRTAAVVHGEHRVGWLGQVHPRVLERFDIPADAVVLAAEFDLDEILRAAKLRVVTNAIPAFPSVKEDLAVVVPEGVPAASVRDVIRAAGGPWLVDVRLFDVYKGPQLGDAGRKSLAFSLTYQAPDRTLTDSEAAGIRQGIINAVTRELGGSVRQ
jgi:phenylalanyl-tRNA synthetase beta chain